MSNPEAAPFTTTSPLISGIYVLFRDRKMTYIGKSKDCYGRIEAHRANGREFDYAIVSACPEQDMGWVEAAMIAALDPVHNRQGRVVAPEPEERPQRAERHTRPEFTATTPVAASTAVSHAKHYKLHREMKAAIDSGAIRSAPAAGKVRHVLWGDVEAWCEGALRKRFGLTDQQTGAEPQP